MCSILRPQQLTLAKVYRVYIYLYIPLQPWPFEVARCYDLYAQQHNLDPARSLVDYSHDPWHDAKILLCV